MYETEATRTLSQEQLNKVTDRVRPGAGMIYDQARSFRGILDEAGLGYLDFFNATTFVIPVDGAYVRNVNVMVEFNTDKPGALFVAEIPLDVPEGKRQECLEAMDTVNRRFAGAYCFMGESSRIVFYADDFLLSEDRSFAERCFMRLYYLVREIDDAYHEELGRLWES